MNETEMIKKVTENETIINARKEVKSIINTFLMCLRDALKDGEEVKIKDLGTLKVVTTKPRKGRNPKTGEAVEIPAKKTVRFKPSPNFIKNILNEGKEA